MSADIGATDVRAEAGGLADMAQMCCLVEPASALAATLMVLSVCVMTLVMLAKMLES